MTLAEKVCPECQRAGKFYTQVNKYRRLDGSVHVYKYEYPYCNKCRYRFRMERYYELAKQE
jgi:hypothetical protein